MRMTLLVMPPVIPLVHDELRMSETQVGLLVGLPLAVFAFAAVPGSLLIARVGTTLAVTLGMTIAAIAGAARAAAVDTWTLYAAAIVSGFGVAIMQPGMPTLVREWLPHSIAVGTIGYSAGMLLGAMFPEVFTIAYVLPAVGGSWRLDVVVWAVPALLMAPVFFLLSPKTRGISCTNAMSKGLWWPDWKNPVVWLLGFTFACNNSPYFVTSAFLGDYLATLGKPELLGASLGWLNGSQIVALAVLFPHRQPPANACLALPGFRAHPARRISCADHFYAILVRNRRGHRGDRYCRRGHDDCHPGDARVSEPARRRAAHGGRHVHRRLYLRDHHSDHLRRTLGFYRQAVDGLRAALHLRGGADGAGRRRDPASTAGGNNARPMKHRPGIAHLSAGAVSLPPPGLLRRFSLEPAGFLQFLLHAAAELVVPVEPAELGAGRLLGEPRPPILVRQDRPVQRFRLPFLRGLAPAFAVFRVLQIIDCTFSLSGTGQRPPAGGRLRADVRTQSHTGCRRGSVGEVITRSWKAACMAANRGGLLTAIVPPGRSSSTMSTRLGKSAPT